VVDFVGLTVLEDEQWDWGFGLAAQSFADLLAPRYARVEPFGKPIVVAELGVSGSPERQADWLAEAGQSLHQFPRLRAVVYFNSANPPVKDLTVLPDWRIQPPLARRLLNTATAPQVAADLTAQEEPVAHIEESGALLRPSD